MKIIQSLLFSMVLLFASSVEAVPVVVSFTDNWVGAEVPIHITVMNIPIGLELWRLRSMEHGIWPCLLLH